MNEWNSGYVSDIGYTYGYYGELNPIRTRLAFLNAGLVPPKLGTHCELGFGQGISINIHAAATQNEWHGTDFNPSQAAFAQELAAGSGAKVSLHDEAFADFCARKDLPDFDSIGLHGIWSWISDDNRAVISDFVKRKLKVGGVLYISYNTQPGWAAMVPMRDLLTEHAEVMGANGTGIVSRIDAALDFIDKLIGSNPTYSRINPSVVERINQIKGQNRNYLAHEYFNRDWLPMSFSRMLAWLSPAKLEFACSANYLDQIDAVNLTKEQQQLLKEITDPMFRESVRDFCVNQQFRRDYWVKGARKLNEVEQAEMLRAESVILVQPRTAVSLKVSGSLGQASLDENVYGPILDYLRDHKPRTLGEIESAIAGKIQFGQLLQAVFVLAGGGIIQPTQAGDIIDSVKDQCLRFNEYVLYKARGSTDLNYLASPVIGGGIPVGRFQQLFLLAKLNGLQSTAEWAQYVWSLLVGQGCLLTKGGKTLQTQEENIAELTAQAEEFARKQLPILLALQVI